MSFINLVMTDQLISIISDGQITKKWNHNRITF